MNRTSAYQLILVLAIYLIFFYWAPWIGCKNLDNFKFI